MKVFNQEFVAALRLRNCEERIQRHPQFGEIVVLMDRLSTLYREVEVETNRRVHCGIAISAATL